MADITALEMTQDILSGFRASGYHYEDEAPSQEPGIENDGIYEFPFAVGVIDDGIYDCGYRKLPRVEFYAVFATRKEAEIEAAWGIHLGHGNYMVDTHLTASGWDLKYRGSLLYWKTVPCKRVA
jgi:hypothetical protein